MELSRKTMDLNEKVAELTAKRDAFRNMIREARSSENNHYAADLETYSKQINEENEKLDQYENELAAARQELYESFGPDPWALD